MAIAYLITKKKPKKQKKATNNQCIGCWSEHDCKHNPGNKKKYTKMFTKKQLRSFVRPMFASTIAFGHATPEQVEKHLDKIFGKRSRLK